ncbi:HAD family hydrolase [Nitrincola sp. MINF-07-Sa-05]|uniref:HAD family hydrolase n=1 Tax=Nitrincola salilacus TaxID=3400273 RepID=UPI003917F0E1
MIKAITFDLDDTLWAVDPVIELANRSLWDWLTENAAQYTDRFILADLVEGSEMRRQLLERHPEISHSVTLIRLKLLEQGMLQCGYTTSEARALSSQAMEVFIEARHQVELFAHARAMLEGLHARGFILGALSNGNAEVKRTGIGDLFEFQYNADQVGQMKPHPLMFEKALEHAALQAEQVIHIGDHPVNDVEAAQQVGMWTIWVNLDGALSWPAGQKKADAEVTSLDQVDAMVDQILSKVRSRIRF